jgi:hypothetical protein
MCPRQRGTDRRFSSKATVAPLPQPGGLLKDSPRVLFGLYRRQRLSVPTLMLHGLGVRAILIPPLASRRRALHIGVALGEALQVEQLTTHHEEIEP